MRVKVCTFAPGQPLAPLLERIQQARIPFDCVEDSQGSHLYVDDRDLSAVTQVLNQVVQPTKARQQGPSFQDLLSHWPITLVCVLLGIVGYGIASFDKDMRILHWLTFTEIGLIRGEVYSQQFMQTYFEYHQWWRLMTPTFLHFGFYHIVFNGLALWEVGRRLEYCLAPLGYGALILILGVGANVAQYLFFGPGIFGGLSGVLYGFFGVLPILYYRTKHPALAMPKAMYVFLAVTLMLGPLGIMEKIFGVRVADGAHFGGLFCGLLVAAVMPLSWMKKANSPANQKPHN